MVDPGFIFDASAQVAAKAYDKWLRAGELERLIRLLDQRFGDSTGLSVSELQIWAEADTFRQALFLISETGDWDGHRPKLRTAVSTLIAEKPTAPNPQEKILVGAVVAAVEELLPQAKQGDELTRYEGRLTRAAITTTTVRLVDADWAPERAKDLIKELYESFPAEGAQLDQALDVLDLEAKVAGLVKQPPRWVREGPAVLLEALAAVAEGTGQWSIALAGWQEAAEMSGGDRVRALVRASAAARVIGDTEFSERLIAQAESMEPEHPHVLLTRSALQGDPARQLELVAKVQPRNKRQASGVELQRAEALIELDRFGEAAAALEKARSIAPNSLRPGELQARLTFAESRNRWMEGQRIDSKALIEAGRTFEALRVEMLQMRAYSDAVGHLAQAVNSYVRAGALDQANRLLDPQQLSEHELAVANAPEMLAELALNAQRPELVEGFVPENDFESPAARLMRATATVHQGDRTRIAGAIATLDSFAMTGEYQVQASVARLIAAARWGEPWSDEAEERARSTEPVLTAVLKSRWFTQERRWIDAERALMPHFDEPRVQVQLIEIALSEGASEKAASRAKDLLVGDPDPSVRMACAMALLDSELREDGIAALKPVVKDDTAPLPDRLQAYSTLVRLALEEERFDDAAELSAAWLRLVPADHRAGWSETQALFRLGRFDEAAAVLREQNLESRNAAEAALAARIYTLTLPPDQALPKVVKLADAQENPCEDLEILVVFAGLGLGDALPEELAPRVSPERFLSSFPDSQFMQALPLPDNDKDIVELFEELAGNTAEIVVDAEHHVFDEGDSPTAVLALVNRLRVGELWGKLSLLPLGYSDSSLDELERADALGGIAVGAVWDPSSLSVTGALGEQAVRIIRQALPKSVLAQCTLDDCLLERASAFGPPTARTEEILERARQMRIEPDTPADDRGVEAELLRREEEMPPEVKTYPATLAVARRLRLPVFSDDRYIRLRARQSGLGAFGTVALIDALETQRYISSDERLDLRRRLRVMGGLGTSPSMDELLLEARAKDFDLTAGIKTDLQDAMATRQNPTEKVTAYRSLLSVLHDEEPAQLGTWVTALLNGLHTAIPKAGLPSHAKTLVLMTWPVDPETNADFFRALVQAIKDSTATLGPVGDPIMSAAEVLAESTLATEDYPLNARLHLLALAIDQLDSEDRSRVRASVLEPLIADAHEDPPEETPA